MSVLIKMTHCRNYTTIVQIPLIDKAGLMINEKQSKHVCSGKELKFLLESPGKKKKKSGNDKEGSVFVIC